MSTILRIALARQSLLNPIERRRGRPALALAMWEVCGDSRRAGLAVCLLLSRLRQLITTAAGFWRRAGEDRRGIRALPGMRSCSRPRRLVGGQDVCAVGIEAGSRFTAAHPAVRGADVGGARKGWGRDAATLRRIGGRRPARSRRCRAPPGHRGLRPCPHRRRQNRWRRELLALFGRCWRSRSWRGCRSVGCGACRRAAHGAGSGA